MIYLWLVLRIWYERISNKAMNLKMPFVPFPIIQIHTQIPFVVYDWIDESFLSLAIDSSPRSNLIIGVTFNVFEYL